MFSKDKKRIRLTKRTKRIKRIKKIKKIKNKRRMTIFQLKFCPEKSTLYLLKKRRKKKREKNKKRMRFLKSRNWMLSPPSKIIQFCERLKIEMKEKIIYKRKHFKNYRNPPSIAVEKQFL